MLLNEDFYPIIYATQKGEIKGILYKKADNGDESNNVQYLNIEEYDTLFNQKYGNIQSLFVDYS